MKKIILGLLCLICLNGCGPTSREIANETLMKASDSDYGNPPPKNYKKLTENYIKTFLKDPDSAKFQNWKEPMRCVYQSINSWESPELGWCTYVEVNAKNSLGGYVGYELYEIRWLNEKIHSFHRPRYPFESLPALPAILKY